MLQKSCPSRNKTLIVLFAVVAFFTIILPSHAYADSQESSEMSMTSLMFSADVPCTITNAEGETLVYDGSTFSGTMGRGDQGYSADFNTTTIKVEDSSYFSYEPASSQECSFSTGNSSTLSASWSGTSLSKFEARAQSGETDVKVISIGGKTSQYTVSFSPSEALPYVSITGKLNANCDFACTKDRISLSGDYGKIKISCEDKKNNSYEQSYYVFGSSNIALRGMRISMSDASKISTKMYKNICGVKLSSANVGKNLFLKWNKVKKLSRIACIARMVRNGSSLPYARGTQQIITTSRELMLPRHISL